MNSMLGEWMDRKNSYWIASSNKKADKKSEKYYISENIKKNLEFAQKAGKFGLSKSYKTNILFIITE